MIFAADLAEKVARGEKVVTRRVVKLVPNQHPSAQPCRYVVGRSYAVQPGRGKRSIARIRIVGVDQMPLGIIGADEARREGFADAVAFARRWCDLHHGIYDPATLVWRIEFELLAEADRG